MNPQLLEAIHHKDIDNIKDKLSNILQDENLDLSSTEVIEALLKIENSDVSRLSGQYIAELGRKEENRKLLTKPEIIKSLLQIISDHNIEEEIVYQAYRALGNICFENDLARKIVDKSGLEQLVNSIKHYVSQNNVQNDKLVTMACGCLLNVLLTNEELQKAVLKMDVFGMVESILRKYLTDFEKHEDCFTHIFIILNAVSENLIDEWFSDDLCSLIVDTLRASNSPEVSTLCLELLRMQADKDEIKIHLARLGTCQLIYELVEKHMDRATDEDSRSVLKMACDLIVLIITGDESMEYLYDNTRGVVYNQMIDWLHSSDLDLLSTGVLAIGNFARKEAHCVQMVENGLAKELLDILNNHNSEEGDIRMQHALLSALRNLCIPKQNKPKLLEAGLVNVLFKLLKVDHSPVVFKLLGTFRMIIDGQEQTAMDLIQKKDFIERIVFWCYNSDHPGVRGESTRLISSLIKNCHSTYFSNIMAVPDCVKCIVEMVSSMHAVMQNEALVALNILAATCIHSDQASACKNESSCTDIENINLATQSCSGTCKEPFPDLLVKADIGKHIAFVINKYYDKMQRETAENILTLLDQITKKNIIIDHLRISKVHDALLTLQQNQVIANALGPKVTILAQVVSGL